MLINSYVHFASGCFNIEIRKLYHLLFVQSESFLKRTLATEYFKPIRALKTTVQDFWNLDMTSNSQDVFITQS